MALVLAGMVKETSTTTSTGTYDLAGAVAGFQTFVAGIGTGNTTYYSVTNGTDWEIGLGTVTDASPDTLARTSILASSNSGSAVNWGAGTKTVRCVFPPGERNMQAALGTIVTRGAIFGLTTSNNSSDATNDIDIAAGMAASDDTIPISMVLSSALTKRLDAAWAVGSGNGGLDTGSIANTTYFVWLIRRSDTGVVDALFSTSASSPTMPTNYDQKRRIGAIIRSGGSIVAFTQRGDEFLLNSAVRDVNVTNPGTSGSLRTLSVPVGIKVEAKVSTMLYNGTNNFYILFTSPDQADNAAAATRATFGYDPSIAVAQSITGATTVRTNTSAQIRTRQSASGANDAFTLYTHGWIDTRGRNA